MKLGKRAPRHDVRTAHMIDYLHRAKLPSIPASVDFFSGAPADLGMMRNDAIGDCGFAGQAHAVQAWTLSRGHMVTLDDESIVTAYSGCTGYSESRPWFDPGVVLLDALKYWRSYGIGSHRISAYMKVDAHNIAHVKTAIALFGGVYTGAQLPLSAQKPAPSETWTGSKHRLTGDDEPGSWGGHCMWASAYDDTSITYVTWGARRKADWQWWLNYADECWVCLSDDWVTAKDPAKSGFDLVSLQAYLAAL